MIGRLLIDECLSPELVQLAVDAGHVESTCVRDRGRLDLKDWELMEIASVRAMSSIVQVPVAPLGPRQFRSHASSAPRLASASPPRKFRVVMS